MNNIAHNLFSSLAAHATKEFLGTEGLTAGEFAVRVARRQQQLLGSGIRPGDHIIVLNERGGAFWIDMVAVWGIGAVTVPLEKRMAKSKVDAILQLIRLKIVLGQFAEIEVEPSLSECTDKEPVVPIVNSVDENQLAAILFTSGSTGDPKGVPITHQALLGNAKAMLEILPIHADDRLLVTIPFRFVSAISHFLTCALSGAAFLGFEGQVFAKNLGDLLAGATAFGGAPLHARWIAQLAKAGLKLNHMRWLMSSGDHLGVDVIDELSLCLPELKIYTVYGLTELAGRFCVLAPADLKEKKGSVGKPIAGLQVAIVDDCGAPVGNGQIGSVNVRGDYLFKGYYKQTALPPGALFDTGDMGYLDDQGFLYLRGRSDDVFKVSGQKVSALVIAQALFATGLFEDVTVLATEHAVLGTVPQVCYVSNQPLDKSSLLADLRTKIDANHLPKFFFAVPYIPRTPSGKVDRKKLTELLASL